MGMEVCEVQWWTGTGSMPPTTVCLPSNWDRDSSMPPTTVCLLRNWDWNWLYATYNCAGLGAAESDRLGGVESSDIYK